MGKWMDGYLERLEINHRENAVGGGEDRIEIQHSLGKLTARERIEKLVDTGSFEVLGSLVRDPYQQRVKEQRLSPSDGVVMGNATIHGRQVEIGRAHV